MDVQPCRQDTWHLHVKSLAPNHKEKTLSAMHEAASTPRAEHDVQPKTWHAETVQYLNCGLPSQGTEPAKNNVQAPTRGCERDGIYLAFTAAAVSRNAWYDFTASGTDMVPNQSKLRPWAFGTVSKTALIFAGGAEAMSLAMATVTASKCACVAPWISFGFMARPASRRALIPSLLAGVFVTYLSSTPVAAQSTFCSMG